MNDFCKYNFIIFCLEIYREKRHLKGSHVFEIFKKTGLFDFLMDGYEVLHTQSKQFILSEISEFLVARDETLSR